MNKINFANPERYQAVMRHKNVPVFVVFFVFCMAMVQLISIGYWYVNRLTGNIRLAVQEPTHTHFAQVQEKLETLAPFLHKKSAIKLSPFYRHGIRPQHITIDKYSMTFTLSIAGRQMVQSNINVLEKILHVPVAIQSIKEVNNQRLVSLGVTF